MITSGLACGVYTKLAQLEATMCCDSAYLWECGCAMPEHLRAPELTQLCANLQAY